MLSFFSQRKKRLAAAVALLIWLLALGTGIANACLVQDDHARHGHPSQHDVDGTSTSIPGMQALADDRDTSPAKVACQNFCRADQSGLIKQQADMPADLDGAIFPASIWWAGTRSADRALQMPSLVDPAWSEPPVFIRFLRLTI